jgi:DNA-binding response OmpR family regulator
MTRVLVVDDEPQIVLALRINLRARKYDVDTAPDGASALHAAARHQPDLVVLDLGLPDMEGTEVIRGLRRHPGKLLSQHALLHDVWGPQYRTETNYLRQYLARLRRKLETDPAHPQHLLTEPGMGYRLQP